MVEPHEFGYTTIGHIDYFRKSRSDLWPLVKEWLQG
jgi:hypothetical protein